MVTNTYLPSYLCDSSDGSDSSESSDNNDSCESSDQKNLFTKTTFHQKISLPKNFFTKKIV